MRNDAFGIPFLFTGKHAALAYGAPILLAQYGLVSAGLMRPFDLPHRAGWGGLGVIP